METVMSRDAHLRIIAVTLDSIHDLVGLGIVPILPTTAMDDAQVARYSAKLAREPLAIIQQARKQQIDLPIVNDVKTEFNRIKREQFPFVMETTKCAPEQAFADLKQALANYFNDIKKRKNGKRRKDGKRVGFPRFKSRKRGYGTFYLSNDQFVVDGHGIRIPKLGWVNMTEALRFDGKIMSARISERAGYWFVSIQVQLPEPTQTAPERVIGVDIGIKSLAVDSDGEVFENQKHLAAALKKLRRLNRWLARKQKGSKNWHKAQRKLARLHLRIANLRADATHKLTTRLVAKARTIALETLNVVGMLKNRKLALVGRCAGALQHGRAHRGL